MTKKEAYEYIEIIDDNNNHSNILNNKLIIVKEHQKNKLEILNELIKKQEELEDRLRALITHGE